MSTILLATSDDPASPYAEMRPAALAWAKEREARVILYDRSAESYFVDPYPSGPWTADVEGAPTRDRLLEPGELETLGRHYLAQQVRDARSAGVDAYAWLPTRPGPQGAADAAERFGADLLILPHALEHPSLLDRVRGNTLERFRDVLRIEVVAADRDGVSALPAGAS